ncbi:HAD family hydrolase [Ilumatobacter sp.]|uniref:HAD family hydrolase n=1 Tax=Ilumatobacter sp. TaxID=1967498 RepID=UPI003750E726
MTSRFDAVLFDAGGVLVLPDPTVLAPLLDFYGGDTTVEAHRRAHYAAMAAKSKAGSSEAEWLVYDEAYVAAVGVRDADLAEAADVLNRTRTPDLWRWPIPETLAALQQLAAAGVPMGVVSNAAGQVEGSLNRSVCQVGLGDFTAMRCIVDSQVVGVEKPSPRIFDFALPHFAEFSPERIAYVGDSVAMDIVSSRAAGLHSILIDPYNDHDGADFERISSVQVLASQLV